MPLGLQTSNYSAAVTTVPCVLARSTGNRVASGIKEIKVPKGSDHSVPLLYTFTVLHNLKTHSAYRGSKIH